MTTDPSSSGYASDVPNPDDPATIIPDVEAASTDQSIPSADEAELGTPGPADPVTGDSGTEPSDAKESGDQDSASESTGGSERTGSAQLAEAGVKTFYALAGLTDAVAEQVRKQAEAINEARQARVQEREAQRKAEAEQLRTALQNTSDQVRGLPDAVREQFGKFMDAFDEMAGRGRVRVDALREQVANSVREGAEEARAEADAEAERATDDAEVVREQEVAAAEEVRRAADDAEQQAEAERQDSVAAAEEARLTAEEAAQTAERLADRIDPSVEPDQPADPDAGEPAR